MSSEYEKLTGESPDLTNVLKLKGVISLDASAKKLDQKWDGRRP